MDNTYNLLIYSTFLCFLSEFSSIIIKPLISLLTQFGRSNFEELRKEITKTQNEMNQLSITNDFARYIKLQRKLNKMQEELKGHVGEQLKYSMKIRYGITYSFRILINIFYLIVCWSNWGTTVLTYPENWLYPFGSILSWPTSISGGISVPNWLLISNVLAKLISSSIKVS